MSSWTVDFAPMLAPSLYWAALAVAGLLVAALFIRRTCGAAFRAAALGALLLALANPTLREEGSPPTEPPARLPGMMKLGGPSEETAAAQPSPTEMQVAQAEGAIDPGAEFEFREGRRTNRDRPFHQQQVIPELVQQLGPEFDPNKGYTYGDVVRQGYRNMPSNEQGQRNLALQLREDQANFVAFINSADTLAKFVSGRPEILGLSGQIAMNGDSLVRQLSGLDRLWRGSGNLTFDPNNPGTIALAEKTTRQLVKDSGLSVSAQQAAIVQSLIIQAAYGYARNVYQPRGQSLSNQEFNKSLQTIGQSGSPEQMVAVLKQLSADAHQAYQVKRMANIGKKEMPVHDWSDKKLHQFGAVSDMTPPALRMQIIQEIRQRIEGRKAARTQPAPLPGKMKLGGPPSDPEQIDAGPVDVTTPSAPPVDAKPDNRARPNVDDLRQREDQAQVELSDRTGINIVMYALTGNYKADQVHIPALLERLGQ